MDDRHEAALFTGFGNSLPLDDEAMKKKADALAARKEGKKLRKEKARSAGKVQFAHYIARRRKQCEKYFFPKEGVFGCSLHPNDKIKIEFESDEGDDDYLPEENYDGDDEKEDELCAGDFDVKWDDI